MPGIALLKALDFCWCRGGPRAQALRLFGFITGGVAKAVLAERKMFHRDAFAGEDVARRIDLALGAAAEPFTGDFEAAKTSVGAGRCGRGVYWKRTLRRRFHALDAMNLAPFDHDWPVSCAPRHEQQCSPHPFGGISFAYFARGHGSRLSAWFRSRCFCARVAPMFALFPSALGAFALCLERAGDHGCLSPRSR